MPEDNLPGGDFEGCIAHFEDERDLDEESAAALCQSLREEAKSEHGNVEELRAALDEGRGLIADVGVDLVSGVDVPAIDSKWVMLKSDSEGHDFQAASPILLSKEEEEKRISYAAAMIPRETDKEGDVAPTSTVEKAAHNFLKQQGGVDTDHSLIDGEGDVIESWILKEERTFDLPAGGEESYPAGTWMTGIEWGAEPWQRIKDGELTGLSIYGQAEHVTLKSLSTTQSTDDTDGQTGDTHKSQDSKANAMGEETTDNSGETEGDTEGPTLEGIAASVDELSETVATLKDTLETTEEKGPNEAEGEIIADAAERIAEARGDGTPVRIVEDELRAALGKLEESEDGDDEEEEEKAETETDDVEKRTEEANVSKGHDGEGTREAAVQKREGMGEGTGLPSYSDAAKELGDL